ncbi:hypothetical protein TNCV_4861771 [Trichonephila clavipes]|nr:hypothetical protein TNCV_4861771 [Trichonephila clavipes]
MPKSNAQRGKEFHERKKKEKLAASPVTKVTKKRKEKQKNIANSSRATATSPSEYMREYRARKKKDTAKYSLNALFKEWECY